LAAEKVQRPSSAKAGAEAEKILAIWNARQTGGRALWFNPTSGGAIAGGYLWLTVRLSTWLDPSCARSTAIPARRSQALIPWL
jgi:hypothetical protein